MAITTSGTSITFNDSTTQTTAAGPGTMVLITELSNQGSTNTFSLTIPSASSYNELILVWQGTQYSGPAGSSLSLTESTTTATYTALTSGSIIVTSTGLNNVTQVATSAGITNFLAAFSTGSSFSRGQVTMTRIKNSDTTTGNRYHIAVRGGSTGAAYQGDYTATGSAVNTVLFIQTVNFSLGLTNNISLRLYGVRQ